MDHLGALTFVLFTLTYCFYFIFKIMKQKLLGSYLGNIMLRNDTSLCDNSVLYEVRQVRDVFIYYTLSVTLLEYIT